MEYLQRELLNICQTEKYIWYSQTCQVKPFCRETHGSDSSLMISRFSLKSNTHRKLKSLSDIFIPWHSMKVIFV